MPPQTHSQHCTRVHTSPPHNPLLALLQARGLGVSELQCQAWGGSADALEASALSLLELDPEFLTVSSRQHCIVTLTQYVVHGFLCAIPCQSESTNKHFPNSSGMLVCQGVRRRAAARQACLGFLCCSKGACAAPLPTAAAGVGQAALHNFRPHSSSSHPADRSQSVDHHNRCDRLQHRQGLLRHPSTTLRYCVTRACTATGSTATEHPSRSCALSQTYATSLCMSCMPLVHAGVYKIRQALVAQAAGADYVAPYLGRIADGVRATYPAINPSETFDDITPEE